MAEITIGAIELTPEERALSDGLILDQSDLRGDSDLASQNGERACELMKLLVARAAIPESRLKYFNDPDYRKGYPRGSRRELFERNKTTGDEIYRHPNFLTHLRYFLLGANLPKQIFDDFSAKVLACGHVGPSDALDLGKYARGLTRKWGLAPHDHAEAFYQLALDCGVYQGHAQVIQDFVRKTR
jgi:hypothetical protein